jgi:hypothetical protein
MSQQSQRDNSRANWLAVIAGLLAMFLLFLIYLARVLSQNGLLG